MNTQSGYSYNLDPGNAKEGPHEDVNHPHGNKNYTKRNCQQMEDSNMICLLLEQNKKKYLEMILDATGCNLIIEKLTLLDSLRVSKLDVSNAVVDHRMKQGYIIYSVEWGDAQPELGGDESHVFLEEMYHAGQILEYGDNEGTIL